MRWTETVIEGDYRYVLPVRLSARSKELAVIQINPSLANGKRSDPTVGKVKKWASERGYGSLYFLNFFAIVNPYQEKIERMNYDLLVGPKNDSFIKSVPASADVIIATGKPKGELSRIYEKRKNEILTILENRTIYCVGDLTKSGHPRHGRMWNLNNRDMRVLKWN